MYLNRESEMVRKTRQETENTKAMILQSALDCFYEKGFSKTTFDDIAARIGLTKGAIYWHFKNKADLLANIIKQTVQKNRKKLGEKLIKPQNIDDLREFFQKDSDLIENDEDLQKFFFFTLFQVEWSDSVFNEVKEKIGDIRNFHIKNIAEALTNAQKSGDIDSLCNIDNLALIITSTWRGLINAYISEEINFSLGEVFIQAFDIIIDGIKTKKG